MIQRLARFSAALALVLELAGPPALAAESDPVVAIVDGVEIHRSDVEDSYRRLPEQYRAVPFEAIFSLIVNSLVDTKLVAGDARQRNIHRDEDFRRQMTRIEDRVLEQTAISRQIKEGTTPKALKDKYEKLIQETSKKMEIRARHILVESEAQAKEIIVELEKDANFAELAKKRSMDPSGPSGGDLGYFTEDQFIPTFTKAAFAIETGRFSKTPVVTEYGWHVIKVEERRNAVPPPYESAEEELKSELSREIGNAYVERLRKGANVQLFNSDGGPMIEAPKKP